MVAITVDHHILRVSCHVSFPFVIFLFLFCYIPVVVFVLFCSVLSCFVFISFYFIFASLHALLFDFHKVLTTFASAVIAQNVLHVQQQQEQKK